MTKSRIKIAMVGLTKLFYTGIKEYPNIMLIDITRSTKRSKKWSGDRCMVDMLELVK